MNSLDTVIWDGDNTIWNWMGYAVPAYEAMCGVLADVAGKSEEETALAMKAFYTLKGTLEDPGLVQGLQAAGFFKDTRNFNLETTVLRAQRTFSQVRSENLRVYPGIENVMEEIRQRGWTQMILTDAPGRQAHARLRRSKLDPYIKEVYSMPSPVVPHLPERFKKESRVREERVVVEEKPNTPLERILGKTREAIGREVAIIGDSDAKDMGLARKYTCLGIHAAYGAANPEYIERIDRFATARVTNRNSSLFQTSSSEDKIRVVQSPDEILSVLG